MAEQKIQTEVDWAHWQPGERATLLFVVKAGRILMIRKKRGLGAGKITGPGGRQEEGESMLACAERELFEEVAIQAFGIQERGTLSFQFTDGYALLVTVYSADDYRGTPSESEEALPFWVDVGAIPYPEMWVDDKLWMPLMLAGQPFSGRFLFEGDKMLSSEVITESRDKS